VQKKWRWVAVFLQIKKQSCSNGKKKKTHYLRGIIDEMGLGWSKNWHTIPGIYQNGIYPIVIPYQLLPVPLFPH
jgi:hypothetical protein